jgi:general secretion pathway protein B
MSFILDALKKSELERQRQAIPGLMDSGAAGSRARFPLWAIALVGLLGINLIALLFVLTRSGGPSAPATHAAGASTVAGAPAAGSLTAEHAAGPAEVARATGAAQRFSPLDAAPVYAPEIPAAGYAAAGDPAPAAESGGAPQPLVVRPLAGAGVASTRAMHRRDPLLTDEDYKSEEEVLPSVSEINLSGQQALPDLHLDVHVFATKPSERFVYINMRKYHEGATLEEGPLLERIRRDGVVLSLNGLRFLLPRRQ